MTQNVPGRMMNDFFILRIQRPPKSTLFPYTTALPICVTTNALLVLVFAAAAAATAAATPVVRVLARRTGMVSIPRSEEHTSELQSRQYLVCRLLLELKEPQEFSVHCPHLSVLLCDQTM